LEGTLGKLNSKQKSTIGTIEKESNRLSTLVTTILDLAKLEQKKIVINPKRIDLYETLFENEYENLAKEKNI
jgi:signal transduction histidine kinase